MARCLGTFLVLFSSLALIAHQSLMSEVFGAAAFLMLMIHIFAKRSKTLAEIRSARLRPDELI